MGVIVQGGNTLIQGGRTRVMLNIVEDGLILFFDPNDNRSYPDSGTSVINIAPQSTNNGVNGTLDASSMYVIISLLSGLGYLIIISGVGFVI